MKVLTKIFIVLIGVICVFIPFATIIEIFNNSFNVYSLIGYLIFGGIFYFGYKNTLSEENKEIITRKHLIIAVIWFFPMGLYLLWKTSKNKILNTVITCIVAFLLAFGFASYTPESDNEESDNNNTVSDEVRTVPNETTTTTTITTTTVVTTETTTTTVPITEPPTEPPTPTPTEAPYVPPVQAEHNYVLNTSTMKFHYPDCTSVNKINSENRSDTYATRDDVISWGYEPCGKCHP